MKLPAIRTPLPRCRAHGDLLLVTVLLMLLVPGCSSIESPARPAGSDSAAAKPAGAPAAGDTAASPAPTPDPPPAAMVTQPLAWQGPDPMEDLEWVTPPDGKWLVDEDGRKYFVTRLRKEPGMDFVAPGRKTIVHKGFYEWAVEREDEEYFYIRKYEAVDDSDVVTLLQQQRKEEEERIGLRGASYKTDIGSADRLTFGPFEEGLPQTGQWRQGFEIADIDGDGNLDIVHGPARKGRNTPTVFLGDGAGRWRLWNAQWPQAGYDYGDVAVADLNGDGRLDLGLGAHLRGLIVLIQTAPGVFESWGKGLPFSIPGAGGEGEGFSSRAVEFTDWNGDGRPDLVGLGEGPRQMKTAKGKMEGLPTSRSYGFGVFLNNGDGTWATLSPGETQGLFGDSLAVADFDDDGHLDAATVTYALGKRSILRLNREEGSAVEEAEVPSLREVSWIFGIAAADFDRDGKTDIVTSFCNTHGGEIRQGLDLSWRDGEGAWQTSLVWTEPGYDAIWALGAGDVDGDGNADVVAMSQTGRALVLLGDGKRGFTIESSPELDPPKNCRGYAVEIRDLDGNGTGEVVAAFGGEVGEMQQLLGVEDCGGGGAIRAWRVRDAPSTGAS